MSVLNVGERLRWDRVIARIVGSHWNGWRMSMIKRGSKQSKVSRIDHSKALAAQTDEAIKERIRTAPAYMYTSLCPVPELREPPVRVQLARLRMWYKREFGGGANNI